MRGSCLRIFQVVVLIAGLFAAGCVGRADPPSASERPPPPVTLSAEAERRVCIQLRNDSGAQVELRSLLVSKIRSKNYQVMQECGRTGYILDIHVLEIRRGAGENPEPEEDFPTEGGPMLGLGVGSGTGGRSGVHVGAGIGLIFPIGTRRFSPPPGYTYMMIAALEIEESAKHAGSRPRTQLQVTEPAPSEAAALPRLEEKMAEAISAILP